MGHAKRLGLILLLGVASCTKPAGSSPLGAATFDQLEKNLETVEAMPERSPTYLVEVVAESGILGKECSALLDDSLTTIPADRGAVMSRAHGVCKMTCPSPTLFAKFREMNPSERDRAIEADCNQGGPDPIFGTDAGARRRTGDDVYLRTRFVVQASMMRLTADGSVRGKLLAARIGALVPHLARALPQPVRTGEMNEQATPAPERRTGDPMEIKVQGMAVDQDPKPGVDLGGQVVQVREEQLGSGSGATADGSAARGQAGRITVASHRALGDSSLTADMLLAKIQAGYMAGLKRCYKQRLAVAPEAKGSMQIRLGVNETGRATGVHVTSFDPDHETCVTGLVESWRFPVPKDPDGEPVHTTFELALDHAAS